MGAAKVGFPGVGKKEFEVTLLFWLTSTVENAAIFVTINTLFIVCS